MVVCFVPPPLVVLRYNPASLHVLFLRFHFASPSISKCKGDYKFSALSSDPFLVYYGLSVVVYYGFLVLLQVLHNPDVASTAM
jgi:hypothetical protein